MRGKKAGGGWEWRKGGEGGMEMITKYNDRPISRH